MMNCFGLDPKAHEALVVKWMDLSKHYNVKFWHAFCLGNNYFKV